MFYCCVNRFRSKHHAVWKIAKKHARPRVIDIFVPNLRWVFDVNPPTNTVVVIYRCPTMYCARIVGVKNKIACSRTTSSPVQLSRGPISVQSTWPDRRTLVTQFGGCYSSDDYVISPSQEKNKIHRSQNRESFRNTHDTSPCWVMTERFLPFTRRGSPSYKRET